MNYNSEIHCCLHKWINVNTCIDCIIHRENNKYLENYIKENVYNE